MPNPQVQVQTPLRREWRWHRGLPGGCRCVYGQPTIARHPECPQHPSLDEIRFWDSHTITLHPDSGL